MKSLIIFSSLFFGLCSISRAQQSHSQVVLFSDPQYGTSDRIEVNNFKDELHTCKVYHLPLKSYWGAAVLYAELAFEVKEGTLYCNPLLNQGSKSFHVLKDTVYTVASTQVSIKREVNQEGDLVYHIGYTYGYRTSHSVFLDHVYVDPGGHVLRYAYYNGSGTHVLIADIH